MAERKAFLLRLPPELHAQLRAWAADEMRSLNAQIEYLLRDAVRRRRGRAGDEEGPEASGSTARGERGDGEG